MSTADTVSKITAHMDRGIAVILDPHPSREERSAIWQHWGSACALCDRSLARSVLAGEIGYIGERSTRAVGNRLLLCHRCAEIMRHGGSWRSILGKSCEIGSPVYAARVDRIEEWQRNHPLPPPARSPAIDAARHRLSAIKLEYAVACRDLQAAYKAFRENGIEADTARSEPDAGPTMPPTVVAPASPSPESGKARLLALVGRKPHLVSPARSDEPVDEKPSIRVVPPLSLKGD
jgi:hypothetical protein